MSAQKPIQPIQPIQVPPSYLFRVTLCFVTQGLQQTMSRCLKIHLRKTEVAHSADE